MFNRRINTNKKKYTYKLLFSTKLYIFRSIKNHFNIFDKKLKRKIFLLKIHKESYWSVSNFSRIAKRKKKKKKISQHPLLLETNKKIYMYFSPSILKNHASSLFINGNQRNLFFFFQFEKKQTILSRTQ